MSRIRPPAAFLEAMDPLRPIAPITARVAESDAYLMSFIFANRPLTVDEQAYLDRIEREAGE